MENPCAYIYLYLTSPTHRCEKIQFFVTEVKWSGVVYRRECGNASRKLSFEGDLDQGQNVGPINKLAGQILFSFSSNLDKDRRTDSRIRRKNTAQPRQGSNPGSCKLLSHALTTELSG